MGVEESYLLKYHILFPFMDKIMFGSNFICSIILILNFKKIIKIKINSK